MDINLAIQEAMQRANDGDVQSAQAILANVLRQEPRNARAWYLLSQIVGDRNREIDCLKKVLEIEPNSQQARARLQKLQQTDVQVQPNPSNPKVQRANTQIQSNTSIPKVQPIAKKPSSLLIILISIVALMALCIVALQIYNAPDATQCVQIVEVNCLGDMGDSSNLYTMVWGNIKNTCDKPITNITLHGSEINRSDNHVMNEATALQSYTLAPGTIAKYEFNIPEEFYDYGVHASCAVNVKSAYFVK